MFLKLALLTVLLLMLSLLGLATGMLLKKNGRFPATSIGKNKEMHKRGITCPRHDELKCYRKLKDGQSCSC